MLFEWDDQKALLNFKKHKVRFTEAVSIWLDANALEICDENHSQSEDRWIRLGISRQSKILVVVYVEKLENMRIRIISARKATKNEKDEYFSRIKL